MRHRIVLTWGLIVAGFHRGLAALRAMARAAPPSSMSPSTRGHRGSLEDTFCAIIFNPDISCITSLTTAFAFAPAATLPMLRTVLAAARLRAARCEVDDTSALRSPPASRGASRARYLSIVGPRRRGARRRPRVRHDSAHLLLGRGAAGAASRRARRRPGPLPHPVLRQPEEVRAAPVGTFHALPVARGKSIFKSNWIRDMGEFYGANLFLAESSRPPADSTACSSRRATSRRRRTWRRAPSAPTACSS